MAKITDTTALNVLMRHEKEGCTESDFYGSGIYAPKEAVERLRQKGYPIQMRQHLVAQGLKEPRWFVSTEHVKQRALERRRASLGVADE